MVMTMIQSSSTVTSTSYKIKDLLLRAWRERWSEIEWGRNIKRLLKGVSGDVYDLADCMLRQAVNGPVTNNRLMLYLNHCLDAQIISFGACIMAITKISDLQPQCINSLLDFLNRYKYVNFNLLTLLLQFFLIKKLRTRTNCYGNDDECLALCRALVSFLYWLHTIIHNSFKSLFEYSSINDYQTFFSQNLSNQTANNSSISTENVHYQIVEKAINLLLFIGDCSYLKALLYIGKMEEQNIWKQWTQLYHQLVSKQWINANNLTNISTNDKCLIEPFIDSLKLFKNKIDWLSPSIDEFGKYDYNVSNHASPIIVAFNKMIKTELDYVPYRPLSYHSIRILISFYAILDTSCSNELLANYLIIVGRAFDLSLSRLYCETLHATLVGLIDTHNLALEDRKNINYHAWIAFLLFKIPHIFVNLDRHRIQLRKEPENNLKESGNLKKNDLEIGIEQLLQFEPCINQFLIRYKTDHLQKLFESFKESSINLLSNVAVEHFMKEINHRMLSSDISTFSAISNEEQHSLNANNSVDSHITNILTLRAEQTTIQILNSLCNDTCTLETLAGIICRIDNSFDIILCAAASNGLLPRFVQQFTELNRTNSYSRGENIRSSQIRAVVFDITFISLCSIVEQYGFEVIKSSNLINNDKNHLNDNSFLSNWFCWNLPSSNVCYAPDIILSSYKESNKYDHLLQQLIILNSSTEFRTSLVSWDDMCIAVQFATAEILNAWIYDAITKDMVKIFLERLKSRLCFLALSSACWLFSKLTTIIHEHQDKVLFMLNELQIPVLSQIDCSIETFASDASENNLSFGYKQRFLLMSSTLKRLFSKYVPHLKSKIESCNKASITPLPIRLSNTPLDVLLKQCLHSTRNHFTLKLICNFDELISLGGPKWFVTQIVNYLFNFNDLASLQNSVDLAYGLFHLDLEQCAIILLKYIVPEFLLSKSTEFDLIEPKLTALIRLTIITTYSAIEQLLKFHQANLGTRCGIQRKYKVNFL